MSIGNLIPVFFIRFNDISRLEIRFPILIFSFQIILDKLILLLLDSILEKKVCNDLWTLLVPIILHSSILLI